MVLPFRDVLKNKQFFIEKQTLNPGNKSNNNHINQNFKKMFKDFFRINQNLPNECALNSYVSSQKTNYRDQSQSPLSAWKFFFRTESLLI